MGVAGLDEVVLDPVVAQHPPGDLGFPERAAARDVLLRRRARGQVEQGRAPPADRQAQRRVEHRHPRRHGPVRLGEHPFERGAVGGGAQGAVHVVVHEPHRRHRRVDGAIAGRHATRCRAARRCAGSPSSRARGAVAVAATSSTRASSAVRRRSVSAGSGTARAYRPELCAGAVPVNPARAPRRGPARAPRPSRARPWRARAAPRPGRRGSPRTARRRAGRRAPTRPAR